MLLLIVVMIIWQHCVCPQLPISVSLALVHPYKMVFSITTIYSATSFPKKCQNKTNIYLRDLLFNP